MRYIAIICGKQRSRHMKVCGEVLTPNLRYPSRGILPWPALSVEPVAVKIRTDVIGCQGVLNFVRSSYEGRQSIQVVESARERAHRHGNVQRICGGQLPVLVRRFEPPLAFAAERVHSLLFSSFPATHLRLCERISHCLLKLFISTGISDEYAECWAPQWISNHSLGLVAISGTPLS